MGRVKGMQGDIAVGIVLFNPENEDRVQRGLDSILEQVEQVYIFDNSTMKHGITFPAKVTYLTEHENKGIAYALNRIMEKAEADDYTWLVTMDQDSILPDNYIYEISKEIDKDKDVAIICPQVIDSRRSYMTIKTEPVKEYVEFSITSASCIRLSSWYKVGKFDEWLFIDLVDNDFCKRITLSGFKILQINKIVLNQEFGKIIPKSTRVQSFWNSVAKTLHNQNFAKFGYKKIVSPARVYYTCRNIIYCNKQYKKYGGIGYKDNYNCNSFLGFIISFILPSILRADKKDVVIKSVIKGLYDGCKSASKSI